MKINLLNCEIKENELLYDDTKQVFAFIHPTYWKDPEKYVDTHVFYFLVFRN